MENKDEQLTYEELLSLCKKQAEYIKELEEKLTTPSDTGKIEEAKPDYYELIAHNNWMMEKNRELESTIDALLYSLNKVNIERKVNADTAEHFREQYSGEHRRANELLEKVQEYDK